MSTVTNTQISQGAPYRFQFKTVNNSSGQNTIRLTFPLGFQSKAVLCDIKGLYGTNPTAAISFDYRQISCVLASKPLYNNGKEPADPSE